MFNQLTVTMLKWFGNVFVGNSLLMYSALTPLAAAGGGEICNLTTPTQEVGLTKRLDEWSVTSFQVSTPESIQGDQ